MHDYNMALSFDDVLLVPKYSRIKTRAEVDLTSTIGSTSFKMPIISSPMDTVTESEMATAMCNSGGLGVIHRYNTIQKQSEIVLKSKAENIGVAVGVSGDFEERACAAYDAGARIICIDVAHGHHEIASMSHPP